jgi:ACS family hexuronate transporter-like MFS transporter
LELLTATKLRWLAVGIFVIASTLNYLDRQLLSTLAPLLLTEFHMDQLAFGYVVSVFSIFYAVASLAAGWILDRFGVTRSICAAVAWWSTAALTTAITHGFGGLLLTRSALAIGESAGIPAVGKLNGIYLKPSERALGAALNQIGISLASIVAPLWIGFAVMHGWRIPFIVTGALGFVWIPIWLVTHRAIPPQYQANELAPPAERSIQGSFSLFRNRNLQILVLANVLWMGSYSLWQSWITLYLVHTQNVSLKQTAQYVWIPPLISNLGGFFGGWLSLRWINRSVSPIAARRRAVWLSAIGALVTLLLPLAPNAAWATALISASFFFVLCGSVNIYALPIDLFGAQHTGMALAALTFAYGILQAVISPIIGFLSDHHLYTQVVWLVTVPLVLSALVLGRLRDASDS